jgi:predicted PurR-regulated permease PerM
MKLGDHLRTTGVALKGWLVAAVYDSLAVGAMWLVGLLIIGVPWAPVWALFAAVLQFIPNFGPIVAFVPPALVALISGGWMRLLYVLILYAVIAVTDGLVLQPLLMKRQTRVPVWASVVTPIVLGAVFNFWGVLLAPLLLAVVFTYREHFRRESRQTEQLRP